MKKLLLTAVFSLVACTKATVLQHGRWSGEGEMPSIESENLKATEQIKSQGEQIEFFEQRIGSYKVENAYLKKIRRQNKWIFAGFATVKDENNDKLLKALERLEKKKDNVWAQFLNRNPIYKEFKLERPVEVSLIDLQKIQPAIVAVLEKADGRLIQVCLDKAARVIREQDLGSSVDGEGQTSTLVYPKGPKYSTLIQALVPRILSPEGVKSNLVEVNTESPLKILNTSILEIPPQDDRFDQTQAFYFSNQILKWFAKKNIFDESLRLQITTQVGYPDKTNTAFYYEGRIRLGSGDDVVYSRIPWDPSIVMHEVSHAVIEHLAQLPYQGEGGSINEGYADFFASFALENPHMGENSYKPASYRRSTEAVLKFSERNGGLYHDSAIVSGLFWALRAQLSEDKIILLATRTLNRLGPDADFEKFKLALNEQVQENFQGEDLAKLQNLLKERELL